jgi:hypothetical protein
VYTIKLIGKQPPVEFMAASKDAHWLLAQAKIGAFRKAAGLFRVELWENGALIEVVEFAELSVRASLYKALATALRGYVQGRKDATVEYSEADGLRVITADTEYHIRVEARKR